MSTHVFTQYMTFPVSNDGFTQIQVPVTMVLVKMTTFKYEALVQAFIENLMKYPGTFIRCPKPLRQTSMTSVEAEEEYLKVFREVCAMLQMMGISYSAQEKGLLIQVLEVPDAQQQI